MSGIYEKEYKLTSSDVNKWQRLRTSTLMRWLQEAAIAHTEQLGMGREKTLDKGILWILTMQRVEVLRMPVYDEQILVRSWPGKTMHVFFPRYYEIVTKETGELLLRASALWMLLDQKTRRFVFPENAGIVIEGTECGREIALPTAPKGLPLTEEKPFAVPFSYVDLNGHMNNTRYFDLADDLLPFEQEGRLLSAIAVEYQHEIREGQEAVLKWGLNEDRTAAFLTGSDTVGTSLFRMRLDYKPSP